MGEVVLETESFNAAETVKEVDPEIVEEYKVWKKNCPYLYDVVVTHALEWPSLTVEWLGKKYKVENKDYSEQEICLGTHTDGAQNYLMLARARLPNEDTDLDSRRYDDEKGELGGYGGSDSKVELKMKMNHDGEVNRSRTMPQDDYVIATRTVAGPVDVFFVRDHETTPSNDGKSKPNIKCKGPESEGYGLDWNYVEKGILVAGSDDSNICRWSIEGCKEPTLEPLDKFKAHDGVIGDVRYNKHHKDIFGSVGDDCMLHIWDQRDLKKPKYSVKAHSKEAQSLSFSPFKEHLILTGGCDNLVKVWDMRKLDKPFHDFVGHQDEIYKVDWAPFDEAIMGSCGADRRVLVWDLSRIGQEQTAEDAQDGPPELLFVHGGHTSKVSDFSFNPVDPWVIASVAEDNILQIWQMAENIYTDDAQNPAEEITNDKLE